MARLLIHLKDICEARGITRMDVVRGADVAYRTASRWWNNEITMLDLDTLVKISRFLGVDESALYTIEDDGDE